MEYPNYPEIPSTTIFELPLSWALCRNSSRGATQRKHTRVGGRLGATLWNT